MALPFLNATSCPRMSCMTIKFLEALIDLVFESYSTLAPRASKMLLKGTRVVPFSSKGGFENFIFCPAKYTPIGATAPYVNAGNKNNNEQRNSSVFFNYHFPFHIFSYF